MSTLMMPAATMTTMTNTAPIAVTQPKSDPAKMVGMINNNRQGKTENHPSSIMLGMFLKVFQRLHTALFP